MYFSSNAHCDLIIAQQLIYSPNGLTCINLNTEKENKEYGACEFEMNNKLIKFRVGKITPTKVGQFVTFYKRPMHEEPIIPYDINDPFDVLIVSVRNKERLGQFIFPKSVLYKHKLLSKNTMGGKRAMRVYPPWDQVENNTAKKTQAWQLQYFLLIDANIQIDITKLQPLLR